MPDEEKKLAKPKSEADSEAQKKLPHEAHKALPEPNIKEEPKIIGLQTKAFHPELKIKELEETVKRLQAEFENYKKRAANEYTERMDFGKMEFAKEILPFADEFENALQHIRGEERKGIEMIFTTFMKSLNQLGIRPMECDGKKFDPYLHDAIKQEESDKEDGTIIAVLRKGYFYKDQVLRHAAVIVSKKKKEDEKDERN